MRYDEDNVGWGDAGGCSVVPAPSRVLPEREVQCGAESGRERDSDVYRRVPSPTLAISKPGPYSVALTVYCPEPESGAEPIAYARAFAFTGCVACAIAYAVAVADR